MNLKHAKAILSGEWYVYNGHTFRINVYEDEESNGGKSISSIPVGIEINSDDMQFMLRQLASKVVREKEK